MGGCLGGTTWMHSHFQQELQMQLKERRAWHDWQVWDTFFPFTVWRMDKMPEVDTAVVTATHRQKLVESIKSNLFNMEGDRTPDATDALDDLLDHKGSNPQSLMWLILRSMKDSPTPMTILAEDMGQVTISMADPEAVQMVGHMMERLVERTATDARVRNTIEDYFSGQIHAFESEGDRCKYRNCLEPRNHPLHAWGGE